jgi:hypothetical protein
MADSFTYWTSNEERREVPITYFRVPAGAKLGAPYRCSQSHIQDSASLSRQMSDEDRPQAKGLPQSG